MTSVALATLTIGTIGVSAISNTVKASSISTSESTATPAKGSLEDLMNQEWGPQKGISAALSGDFDNVNVEALSVPQLERMQRLIAEHSVKTKNGSDTTIIVADSVVIGAYDAVITGKPFSENRAYHGKTKVVWHGAAKKGNLDVYISQSALGGAYGVAAAGHLIGVLIAGAGENAPVAVKQMVSAIKSTVKAGHLKGGVHFIVRGWHVRKAK